MSAKLLPGPRAQRQRQILFRWSPDLDLYERKVAVYERMLADGTADAGVATRLAEARARMAEVTAQVRP